MEKMQGDNSTKRQDEYVAAKLRQLGADIAMERAVRGWSRGVLALLSGVPKKMVRRVELVAYARMLLDLDDEEAVAQNVPPAHAAAMSRAQAVISEKGGPLAHLAIVGRESGIPVLRVPDACTRFPAGVRITVIPDQGRIRYRRSKP